MLDPNDPRMQYHIKRMVDENLEDSNKESSTFHGPTYKPGTFVKALIIGLIIGIVLAILAHH